LRTVRYSPILVVYLDGVELARSSVCWETFPDGKAIGNVRHNLPSRPSPDEVFTWRVEIPSYLRLVSGVTSGTFTDPQYWFASWTCEPGCDCDTHSRSGFGHRVETSIYLENLYTPTVSEEEPIPPPGNSNATTANQRPASPQTGDALPFSIYILIITSIVSLLGIGYMVKIKRK